MDEVRQVLFGMNGFRVLNADVDPLDAELEVVVETIDPTRGCPDCGVVGQVKQRPVVRVRDATSAGRRAIVRWRKRRWACLEPTCERGSWTEQHEEVGVRRRTTQRCREQVAKAVTRGRSVAEAADEVGLGWRAAMGAVAEHATIPDRFRPVRRLGVDETVSRRRRRFVTHLVDLDDGTVITTVEGRSAVVLLQALAAQGEQWRAGVEQVAIDPFTPYAKAVRHLLPHARLVVDKFHVLRLFARSVDLVRRRTVQQAEGRRGRKLDRLWRSRMLLLKRFERLTDRQQERLLEALDTEDVAVRSRPPTWPTKKLLSCSTGSGRSGCAALSLSSSAASLTDRCPSWPGWAGPSTGGCQRSSPTSRPARPTPPPRAATARSSRSSE